MGQRVAYFKEQAGLAREKAEAAEEPKKRAHYLLAAHLWTRLAQTIEQTGEPEREKST